MSTVLEMRQHLRTASTRSRTLASGEDMMQVSIILSYLISHEAAGVICAREPVTLDHGCGEADSLCLAGGHTPASGNVYLGGR